MRSNLSPNSKLKYSSLRIKGSQKFLFISKFYYFNHRIFRQTNATCLCKPQAARSSIETWKENHPFLFGSSRYGWVPLHRSRTASEFGCVSKSASILSTHYGIQELRKRTAPKEIDAKKFFEINFFLRLRLFFSAFARNFIFASVAWLFSCIFPFHHSSRSHWLVVRMCAVCRHPTDTT